MTSTLVSSKLRLVYIAFFALFTLVLTLTFVTGGASAAEPEHHPGLERDRRLCGRRSADHGTERARDEHRRLALGDKF